MKKMLAVHGVVGRSRNGVHYEVTEAERCVSQNDSNLKKNIWGTL